MTKNIMNDRVLIEEFRAVWRLVVPMVVLPTFGAIAALSILRWSNVFNEAFVGGGAVLPVGLIVGLIWQLSDPIRRYAEHRQIYFLLIFTVCAVFLPAIALIVASLPQHIVSR